MHMRWDDIFSHMGGEWFYMNVVQKDTKGHGTLIKLLVNEINNFTNPTPKEVKNVSVSSNMKGLMSKMISCVINYPSLVNDPESSGVIEERAKKLPKSDVLMELIHSAQIEPDITKEALIKPYEKKNIVSRNSENVVGQSYPSMKVASAK